MANVCASHTMMNMSNILLTSEFVSVVATQNAVIPLHNYHREASMENGRLRGLLSMREDLQADALVASVVTVNVTGSTRVLVIDQGLKEGLSVDLPVVSAGGAVGRIVAAFDHYSKVLLLTDSDSGVGAVIQRSRAQVGLKIVQREYDKIREDMASM